MTDRRSSITDPAGLALLLGATVMMAAMIWVKARGLPFVRSRDDVTRH